MPTRSSMLRLAGSAVLLLAVVVGSAVLRGVPAAAPQESLRRAPAVTSGPLPFSLTPTTIPPASPELLALGKRVYEKQCAACHGFDGRGEGEAAYLLYPKPRDFTAGKFALVSTWDRVPTDEDLFRTISRGMPGSAMPSWAHLSEEERWGLVHYLKSFAQNPWTIPAPADPKGEGSVG
ncbi:MAG: cytochrome c, partial [Candidatus Rokubacteria bacterium]|nr:cytochrome c [Candidatus Rokubacteria bacterium]